MKIVIENSKPVIQGLPNGNVTMFFAKINERRGYCVVFGPAEECLFPEGTRMNELISTQVAFGTIDSEMEIVRVTHGHKYAQGGGFVDFQDDKQIFFRLSGDEKLSTYEGTPIEEVYEVI